MGDFQEASPPKTMMPTKRLSTVMKMLAKKTVQNPEMLKPRISFATSIRSKALMTNRKRPKVIIVKGSVNTMRPGKQHVRRTSSKRPIVFVHGLWLHADSRKREVGQQRVIA